MSDQVYTQQSNGASLSQFPVMHLHPDSINTLVSKQRSNTNTVQTNPSNPLDVAVTNFTIPDANSLTTSYTFLDTVLFQWDVNVTDGWSCIVNFSRNSGNRPTNQPGPSIPVGGIPTTLLNMKNNLARVNVVDSVRIQALELVSSLPLSDPSQCYMLAVYNLNLPYHTDLGAYLFNPTNIPPDLWLSLDGSNPAGYTANRQLVIAPDPIGLSLEFPSNSALFVLCGPYALPTAAPPSSIISIVLVPRYVGEVLCGALMSLRYVTTWSASATRSNLGFAAKRPTLM